MLEMVRKYIHQFEFHGLSTPNLTKPCGADAVSLCFPIDSVEDRHASEVSMAKGTTVAAKIVVCRVNDDFKVPSKSFHIR
jgi:hypothetical protein